MFRPAFRIGCALLALWCLGACAASSGEAPAASDSGRSDTRAGDSGTVEDVAILDLGGFDVIEDSGTSSDADVDGAQDGANADVACNTFGCACSTDDDCRSGYCIEDRVGGMICTDLCNETCDDPDFECRLLENTGGDAVRLCVPSADPYCTPCEIDTDCDSLRARCVTLDDGNHCVSSCRGEAGLCRSGAECAFLAEFPDDERYCVPVADRCAGCTDEDDDGYGRGPDCLGPDDNDANPDVYPGAPELCDGADNNGDGTIDEGFDLQNDLANCGACGAVCAFDRGTPSCAGGVCTLVECERGWSDCDGDLANGCETDVTTLDRCGTCEQFENERGDPCGLCGEGTFACGGTQLVCDAEPNPETRLNACGGCDTLDAAPEDPCGTCNSGVLVCEGTDGLRCEGDQGEAARNACGGCTLLEGAPGDACGPCGLDTVVCGGPDTLVCNGSTDANACGGCSVLAAQPGDPCGGCGLDAYVCDGLDGVACSGDSAANACGGCFELVDPPGTSCGPCGRDMTVCADADTTTCTLSANCPPSAPVASLQPDPPSPASDLTCVREVDAIDSNGDALLYSYDWLRDDVDAGVGNVQTVPAAALGIGERWSCRVRATDGEEPGPWSERVEATVVDSCVDLRTNGNETDVDCGGEAAPGAEGACARCAAGRRCDVDADCAEGLLCDESTSRCTAVICTPGETSCDALDNVVSCNERGTGTVTVETCSRLGCSDAACVTGCGDGLVQDGEGCDAGALNSDTTPDACRTNCQPASCGDYVVDSGEDCDAGDENEDDVPGVCSTECILEIDGVALPYRESFPVDGLGFTGPGPTGSIGDANWDLDVSRCDLSAGTDYARVESGALRFRDLDGDAIWTSPVIVIGSVDAVELSLRVEQTGDIEGSSSSGEDYVDVEYIVDEGAPTLIQNWNGLGTAAHTLVGDRPDDGDFPAQTIVVGGIEGGSLQIRVRVRNNAGDENIWIDDIAVSAE